MSYMRSPVPPFRTRMPLRPCTSRAPPPLWCSLRVPLHCSVHSEAPYAAAIGTPSKSGSAREPAQLEEAVRDFLAGKGVDVGRLAQDLRGYKRSQLTLPQARAVCSLLGADYGLSAKQLATLVYYAPGLMLLDAEGDMDYLTLSKLRKFPAGDIELAHNTLAFWLRMPRGPFGAALLGDHYAMQAFLQDPALLTTKLFLLKQGLGSKEAVQKVALRAPEVLRMAAAPLKANLDYLSQGLRWAPETVAEFIASQPRVFTHKLTSPTAQRLLRSCREVLGLTATAMLQWHGSALRSSAATSILRLAFVARHGLQQSLGASTQQKLSNPARVDASFLWEGEADWKRRLREGWGLDSAEWLKFAEEHGGSEAWQALMQAEKEFQAAERGQNKALKAGPASGYS